MPREVHDSGRVTVQFTDEPPALVRPFQLNPATGVQLGFTGTGKLASVTFPADQYPGLDATVQALKDCPLCTEMGALAGGDPPSGTPLRQQVLSASAKGRGRNGLRMPIPEYVLPESAGILGGKSADEIVNSLTATKPMKYRDPAQTILGIIGAVAAPMVPGLSEPMAEGLFAISLVVAAESGARLLQSQARKLGASRITGVAPPAPSLGVTPPPLPPPTRVVRGFQ